ncbi:MULTISPECIES: aldo/keto reductase [unclassified Cryobacterium]|uniref:aldo/keto reductase n=1 Tax=unclassified Cryobacterium TaxID=2649013 RepID=UPI001445E807|nr:MULTISPECIES: aldo/keto reductase [unclassified Cryobacterium]
MTIPLRTLNDGNTLPAIGFGTYRLRGEEAITATGSAIENGYRLIDTALNYGNEKEVGEAIRRSSVPREELFVTTKLPGRFHGLNETFEGFRESLEHLGLDYVDLFLIHWPLPRVDKYVDSWRAMIRLREEGVIRSIGVSNFTPAHLERVIAETDVVPAVNQVELHPYFPQGELRRFHAEHGIQTESWTPLARKKSPFTNEKIREVADAHGVTPAQAILRWHVQLGTIPIPKASTAERQRENIDIFGFELTDEQVESISSLEEGRLWGGDPDTNEEF